MKLLYSFLIIIFLLSTNNLYAQNYKDGEVIILYKDGAIGKSSNLQFKRVSTLSNSFKISVVKSNNLSTSELIDKLSTDPNIAYIEPNYKYHIATTPNDELFDKQWGLKNIAQEIKGVNGVKGADINATIAWNTTTGSNNYVVAILDTGVDYNHTDLSSNIWQNSSECTNSWPNGLDDDNNGYIDDCYGYDFASNNNGDNDYTPYPDLPYSSNHHYHGTHVAGIIGAKANNLDGIAGVNWNIKIMSLKIFQPNGDGYSSDILEAYEYITTMKDKGVNIVVANASYSGGEHSYIMKQAIENLEDRGVLLVAAAGNNESNIDHFKAYPASYDCKNIIAVAATNNKDELAYFSNYGKESVDIAAPGEDIISTIPSDSHNEYRYLSGTSMATPFVTGAVALAYSSLESNLTNSSPKESAIIIKNHILGTAKTLDSLKEKIKTGARLDLAMAVTNRVNARTTIFNIREQRLSKLQLGGDSNTDSDGDLLTVTNLSTPANGTANIEQNTTVNYSPDSNFTGTDYLIATIKDSLGKSKDENITINVTPNNPPIAKNDTVTVRNDTNVTINALYNDSDADDDILVIKSLTKLPKHGVATINSSKITYFPNRDFVGTDKLKYQISDDLNATSEATVTITVTAKPKEINNKETETKIKHSNGNFNILGAVITFVFIILLGIKKL